MASRINSRNKGASAERELAKLLQSLFLTPLEIKRNLEQTRLGGFDLVGVEGWAIEVKRYASVTDSLVDGWWNQTLRQAKESNRRPVLFYRQDRQDWKTKMLLAHLVEGKGVYEHPGDAHTITVHPMTWVLVVEGRLWS